MPSAAVLRSLPYPDLMKRRLRTFAMVDAILAPELRAFEWHPKWSAKEQMGAFKDGEGNFFFAWFCPAGAVIRGFDHESPMSPFRVDPPRIWPGIFDRLPKKLSYANQEPAFALDEVTFCCWAIGREGDWTSAKVKLPKGSDPDGSKELLACFGKYRAWAEKYYGRRLDARAIERIWWEREPLDWSTAEALNPELDEAVVREEAKLLGWKADLPKRSAAKPKPAAKRKPAAKPKAAAAAAKPKVKSFGAAEFVVRCEPTRVVMRVHGKDIAVSNENIYGELFDLVRARFDQR